MLTICKATISAVSSGCRKCAVYVPAELNGTCTLQLMDYLHDQLGNLSSGIGKLFAKAALPCVEAMFPQQVHS